MNGYKNFLYKTYRQRSSLLGKLATKATVAAGPAGAFYFTLASL
jgi:hypothetical protein